MSRHTLSILVENKSGVLARVAALFRRRGFNIESLAVGPTENPDLSRMTIVVDADTDTVTLEATGTPDKLQALLAVLAPLGIKEMAQSGTVALGRGPRSMSGTGTLRPVERSA